MLRSNGPVKMVIPVSQVVIYVQIVSQVAMSPCNGMHADERATMQGFVVYNGEAARFLDLCRPSGAEPFGGKDESGQPRTLDR